MEYPQTVTCETPEGDAEAVKEDRNAYWVIGYPWTDRRFYGSVAEVKAEMKRMVKAYKKQEEDLAS